MARHLIWSLMLLACSQVTASVQAQGTPGTSSGSESGCVITARAAIDMLADVSSQYDTFALELILREPDIAAIQQQRLDLLGSVGCLTHACFRQLASEEDKADMLDLDTDLLSELGGVLDAIGAGTLEATQLLSDTLENCHIASVERGGLGLSGDGHAHRLAYQDPPPKVGGEDEQEDEGEEEGPDLKDLSCEELKALRDSLLQQQSEKLDELKLVIDTEVSPKQHELDTLSKELDEMKDKKGKRKTVRTKLKTDVQAAAAALAAAVQKAEAIRQELTEINSQLLDIAVQMVAKDCFKTGG